MLRFLMLAAVLSLREEFESCKENIDLGLPGGRPPPFAGQVFMTVWSPSETNSDDRPEGLDETFTIKVTITFRLAWAPTDRKARVMAEAPDALYAYADRAKRRIHGSYLLLKEANTQYNVAASAVLNGAIEPLVYKNTVYQDRDPSWFFSTDEKPSNDNNGYTAELTFNDGRCVSYSREN